MAGTHTAADGGHRRSGPVWLTAGLWLLLALMLAGMAALIVPACGFSTPGGQTLLWFCPGVSPPDRPDRNLVREQQRQRALDHRLDSLRLAMAIAPDCPIPPTLALDLEEVVPVEVATLPEPAPLPELPAVIQPEPTPARIPPPPEAPDPEPEPEPGIAEAVLPAPQARAPEPEPQIEVAVLRPEPSPDYLPPRPVRRPAAPARPPPPRPPVAVPAAQPAPQPTPQPAPAPARVEPALPPARSPQSIDYDRRLDRVGVPPRDVMVTLIWDNVNDLDLHVLCPSGVPIYYANMAACGGQLDVDSNGPGPETSSPIENVSWTNPAPGRYRVEVRHFDNHGAPDPTRFRLRVRVGERETFHAGVLGPNGRTIVTEFTVP